MSDAFIDSKAIAALCGSSDPFFAHAKQRRDATFPRQQMGGTGIGHALWSANEITAWLPGYQRGGKRFYAEKPPTPNLDNAKALCFICQRWPYSTTKALREQALQRMKERDAGWVRP